MALYRLSLNAANLEYFIDNVLQFSSPLAGVTSHTINAGATNDTLQIVGLISLTGGSSMAVRRAVHRVTPWSSRAGRSQAPR